MFARGILTIGTHNMSYAHSDDDIAALLRTYDEVFGILRSALDRGNITSLLRTAPLVPLFRVR